MKLKLHSLIVIVQFLCYTSAEFLKMKKPYLPPKELNLKRFLPENFNRNINIELDRNRHLEYIRKYFPGFNSRKTNAKFHEIDDPVIQQHKYTPRTSTNISNHNKTSSNKTIILSLNGITLSSQQQQHHTNETTFRPAIINVSAPSPSNIIECPDDNPNGIWSPWILAESCTSDCGSCGRLTRTRQCLSFNGKSGNGCPCRGEYKQIEACNIGVCQFPKPSCCPPFNLIFIEGHFACGPHNETIVQTFLRQFLNG